MEIVHAPNSLEKIIIFSVSIPQGTRLNNLILTSTQVMPKRNRSQEQHRRNYYIDLTLKDGSFDTVITYVGVNDLLKDKNIHSTGELVKNLKNIALKCPSFGITKAYTSGTVKNNEISHSLLENISTKISEMCLESSCGFVDKDDTFVQRCFTLSGDKNVVWLEIWFIF